MQARVEFDKPVQLALIEHDPGVGSGTDRVPAQQECLHVAIELAGFGQFRLHLAEQGGIGEPVLEHQLAQHSPVIGVVPDHLHRHHFGIAKDRVLAAEQAHGVFVERAVQLLEQARVRPQRFVGAIQGDQFGDIGVGHGDEVAARRIERIKEHARLAGECPAVTRVQLLATVREAAQETEVEQLVAMPLAGIGHQRLEFTQPVQRALEGVHPVQWMDGRIADDANRMCAGTQWNQPHPVALAAQVIGRAPTFRWRAALLPSRIRDPFVHG